MCATNDFAVADYLEPGVRRPAFGEEAVAVEAGGTLRTSVPAHGAQVYFLDAP